jgi:hypothetical protein
MLVRRQHIGSSELANRFLCRASEPHTPIKDEDRQRNQAVADDTVRRDQLGRQVGVENSDQLRFSS